MMSSLSYSFTSKLGWCDVNLMGDSNVNSAYKQINVPAPRVYAVDYDGQSVIWQTRFYDSNNVLLGSLATGATAHYATPAQFQYGYIYKRLTGGTSMMTMMHAVSQVYWQAANGVYSARLDPMPLNVTITRPTGFGGYTYTTSYQGTSC
jgi:hypothetical protein